MTVPFLRSQNSHDANVNDECSIPCPVIRGSTGLSQCRNIFLVKRIGGLECRKYASG